MRIRTDMPFMCLRIVLDFFENYEKQIWYFIQCFWTLFFSLFHRNLESKNIQGTDNCRDNSSEKKKPHIKKPLNAFMLYMKEMRAKVVAECTLKESAAINQILGRRVSLLIFSLCHNLIQYIRQLFAFQYPSYLLLVIK